MASFDSIAKFQIIGRLGVAPEINKDYDRAKFSVAVSDSYYDKNVKSWKTTTSWIDVESWGRMTKFAEKLQKGYKVFLAGNIKTSSWKGKDGKNNKRTVLNMVEGFIIDKGKDPSKPKYERKTSAEESLPTADNDNAWEDNSDEAPF